MPITLILLSNAAKVYHSKCFIVGCCSARVPCLGQAHPHHEGPPCPRRLHDGGHLGGQSGLGEVKLLHVVQKTFPGEIITRAHWSNVNYLFPYGLAYRYDTGYFRH